MLLADHTKDFDPDEARRLGVAVVSPDEFATCSAPMAPGRQRLVAAGITRLLVTDSLPVEVQSIAALVADAVGRLHRDEDLADLLGQHVTS